MGPYADKYLMVFNPFRENMDEKRPQMRIKGKKDRQIDNQINRLMCQKELCQNFGFKILL